MAAPSFIAAINFASGGTATENVTFDLDTLTIEDGDFLFVDLSHAYDGVPVVTKPSGWVTLWDSSDATSLQSGVFYYECDGTETGTITFTLTNGADYRHPNAVLHQWRGVNPSNPVNVSSGPSNNYSTLGRQKNVDAQSITTTVDDCAIIAGGTTYIGQRVLGATSATVIGNITGSVADSHYSDLIVARGTQATAGATGTTQLTSTNEAPTSYWTYWRYAIEPASSHNLTPQDIECASEIEAPALTQLHDLATVDIECASEIEAPALTQLHDLITLDLQCTSEIGGTSVSQLHDLITLDLECASEIEATSIDTGYSLITLDLECASEIAATALTQLHDLITLDLECASEIEATALTQLHDLITLDLECASEIEGTAITTDGPNLVIAAIVDGAWRATPAVNGTWREIDTVAGALWREVDTVAGALWRETVSINGQWKDKYNG